MRLSNFIMESVVARLIRAAELPIIPKNRDMPRRVGYNLRAKMD